MNNKYNIYNNKLKNSFLRIQVPANDATVSNNFGPLLGQAGININSFCKIFNLKTFYIKKGLLLNVLVHFDNTFLGNNKPFLIEIKKVSFKDINYYNFNLVSFYNKNNGIYIDNSIKNNQIIHSYITKKLKHKVNFLNKTCISDLICKNSLIHQKSFDHISFVNKTNMKSLEHKTNFFDKLVLCSKDFMFPSLLDELNITKVSVKKKSKRIKWKNYKELNSLYNFHFLLMKYMYIYIYDILEYHFLNIFINKNILLSANDSTHILHKRIKDIKTLFSTTNKKLNLK